MLCYKDTINNKKNINKIDSDSKKIETKIQSKKSIHVLTYESKSTKAVKVNADNNKDVAINKNKKSSEAKSNKSEKVQESNKKPDKTVQNKKPIKIKKETEKFEDILKNEKYEECKTPKANQIKDQEANYNNKYVSMKKYLENQEIEIQLLMKKNRKEMERIELEQKLIELENSKGKVLYNNSVFFHS